MTGLSMVETDGPYGGYSCHSTSHKHHHDITDSVYQQEQLQGQFYTKLREMNVYINQPDNFFYQGGSKTGKHGRRNICKFSIVSEAGSILMKTLYG